MDIIVLIKQVPDPNIPANQLKIDEQNKRVIQPPSVPPVINGYDENAVEAALQIKEQVGGKITAISLGPPEAKDALKRALAMGVDEAVLLSDPSFQDGDAWSTALALARAVQKAGPFDLVLCGRQASDWDQASVGLGVAEMLGIPGITPVQKLELAGQTVRAQRVVETGYELLEVRLPAVIAISSEFYQPRYPTLKGIMMAAKKPLATWSAADLGVSADQVGVRGRKVELRRLYAPVQESQCEFVEGDSPEEKGRALAQKLRAAKVI